MFSGMSNDALMHRAGLKGQHSFHSVKTTILLKKDQIDHRHNGAEMSIFFKNINFTKPKGSNCLRFK